MRINDLKKRLEEKLDGGCICFAYSKTEIKCWSIDILKEDKKKGTMKIGMDVSLSYLRLISEKEVEILVSMLNRMFEREEKKGLPSIDYDLERVWTEADRIVESEG